MNASPDMLPTGIAHALPSLPDGWHIAGYATLADGALAILGTDMIIRPSRDRGPTGSDSPFARAQRASAQIWTFDGEMLVNGPAFPLASPYLLVDRFPDGRWLVARRYADPDRGERILSPKGDPLGSVYLGDGLSHLKIDDAERIWVGWTDEGILGNDSWHIAGRSAPPSRAGLAAFNDRGDVVVEAGLQEPRIDDCYALNITGETAWACTYATFPIIALDERTQRRWTTSLCGMQALAVDGDHILAAGGYGEDANQLILLKCGGEIAQVVGKWRLPFPPSAPGSQDAPFLDGRGDKLHLVHRGVWHQWTVRDFVVA